MLPQASLTSTISSNCASQQHSGSSSCCSSAPARRALTRTSSACTGVADEARRGSFAPALISSTERTQLFQFCLTCIEAFLNMETGDEGHHGPARAATTAGLPEAPADQPTDCDQAAVVRHLQAQHKARAADIEKNGTTARRRNQICNATRPCSLSARPPGRASGAR